MNIKLHTAFFGAIIIFFPVAQAAEEQSLLGRPVAQKPNKFSMVGTWKDIGTDARIIFSLDDKSKVSGLYGTEIYHFFNGEYARGRKIINLTVMRVDKQSCRMIVNGWIKIINNDEVKFKQEQWYQSCGLTSEDLEKERIKYKDEWRTWHRISY